MHLLRVARNFFTLLLAILFVGIVNAKNVAAVLPAVINAAAFRAGAGNMRIIASADADGNAKGGSKVVCGSRDGWLAYDIETAKAGAYTFTLRAANVTSGANLRIAIDDKYLDSAFSVPNTGSWAAFADIKSKLVKLTAGKHTLKVVWDSTTGPKFILPRLHYIDIAAPIAIRINAGDYMDYTDSAGNVWQPDTGFVDGDCVERGEGVIIKNSKDVRIYRTEHFGMSRFALKVPNGNYIARLHFAETFDDRRPGSRVFKMTVQDVDFPKFDLIGEAGGSYRALIKTVPVSVENGEFVITFFATNIPSVTINGIELLQAE